MVVQCIVLLATLAACEMILRVIDLRYLRMDESGVAPVYAHDAELGWYPIPNSAQTYSGARTVHVRHNSIGLRDIELGQHDIERRVEHGPAVCLHVSRERQVQAPGYELVEQNW